MNKYQEAFRTIERTLEYNCDAELEIIYELVKKAISKKPIYKDDGTGDHYYYCANCDSKVPLCSNLIDQIKYKHCPYCGNEIDWSDTNE